MEIGNTMKLHEFKIRKDTVTGQWQVWVKIQLMFFWTCWQPVYKEENGIFADPYFKSQIECMAGIEKWKREHTPDYKRYETYHQKL